jgi:phytoene dehydrogenase-like protein
LTDYDVAIVGAGIGGLATGALLAAEGFRVGVFEQSDALGGYARSFAFGGFDFCYQVQYLMGCEPGGPVNRFLRKLGLDETVKFNALDPRSYDVVAGPDRHYPIPTSLTAFERAVAARFPAERQGLRRFFRAVDAIFTEGRGYDGIISGPEVALRPQCFPTLLRYVHATLADVFDRCGFGAETRLWLAGQMGNLGAAPSEVSFCMYSAMLGAYCRSAAYPRLGMRHMIEQIGGCITSGSGSAIHVNSPVTRLLGGDGGVAGLEVNGKIVTARHYISNIDPRRTAAMLGGKPFTRAYDYSPAVISLYLGFEGLELGSYGFGKRNVWYHSLPDVDAEFRRQEREDDYSEPWVFISTPSELADRGVLCAPRRSSMVMLTFGSYQHFERLHTASPRLYREACEAIAARFLGILRNRFIPGIDRYVVASHLEGPLETGAKTGTPAGNVYGAKVTPRNWGLLRQTRRTPFHNLHLVGATACYPGVMPIMVGAMELVTALSPVLGRPKPGRRPVPVTTAPAKATTAIDPPREARAVW